MPYGSIKANSFIYEDDNEDDVTLTMETIASNSTKVDSTGATFTGDVILDNEQELRLMEADDGTDYIAFKAPATLNQTSTWTLPDDIPVAGNVLKVNSVADTNNPTLEWGTDDGAQVSDANTWTAAQRAEITNIDSSSGTLDINFDDSNSFLCITTENITDINYTNLDEDMVGQTGSIFFQYGGAHTVGGWDTETRWIGGTGGTSEAPTFTATSGQCDRVDYIIVGDRDTPSQRSHVRVQMVASLNYAD